IACPCGNNPGGPGRGCNNSTLSGGATLVDAGAALMANDDVVFTATDMLPGVACALRQGDAAAPAGLTFGDGVKCWGGLTTILYTKVTSISGTVFMPDFSAGDQHIAKRSEQLGDMIAPGSTR